MYLSAVCTGGIDERSLTRPLSFQERRDDPERRPDPGAHVDQGRADAGSWSSGLSRHADETAGRLHQRVVAWLLRERADVPVRADRAVHEPGVAPRTLPGPRPIRSASPGRRLCRNTSACSASRSTTARPRSSASETASERLPAFTDRNIALSPFQNGGPTHGRRHPCRALDLDHLGAQCREDFGAVRPGDRRRHVDDACARER